MDVDHVLVVLRVAAGHRDRDRHAARAQRLEHQAVASGETALGQRETAEAIAFEWIGAGEEDRELRPRRVERACEREPKRGEIRRVAGAGQQWIVAVEQGATADATELASRAFFEGVAATNGAGQYRGWRAGA